LLVQYHVPHADERWTLIDGVADREGRFDRLDCILPENGLRLRPLVETQAGFVLQNGFPNRSTSLAQVVALRHHRSVWSFGWFAAITTCRP
jgi:hypothetical protein